MRHHNHLSFSFVIATLEAFASKLNGVRNYAFRDTNDVVELTLHGDESHDLLYDHKFHHLVTLWRTGIPDRSAVLLPVCESFRLQKSYIRTELLLKQRASVRRCKLGHDDFVSAAKAIRVLDDEQWSEMMTCNLRYSPDQLAGQASTQLQVCRSSGSTGMVALSTLSRGTPRPTVGQMVDGGISSTLTFSTHLYHPTVHNHRECISGTPSATINTLLHN